MKIVLDMDGTIADLYNVPGWLEMLRAENVKPYAVAAPLCDMGALRQVLRGLQSQGHTISIVSWCAMGASAEYARKIALVKKAWLYRYKIPADSVYIVPYGVDKEGYRESEEDLLVDDSETVLANWKGRSVNPTKKNLVSALRELLKEGDRTA